jgi:hypothetical protein
MATSAPTDRGTNLSRLFRVDSSFHENQKIVENHKKAADHYHLAARSHVAAAHHHEAGAFQIAAEDTVAAYGHSLLAREYQKELAKNYALKNV